MATDGYLRGKPDPAWWGEEITAGVAFRKKYAHENEWKKWRSYYRGDWSGDILPVNLFFTLMRTVVPRIYFRDPSVSVSPSKPGFLNMGFARILERVDNKLMKQMRMKRALKQMVQEAFMFGTAVGKLGFGAVYSPTPTEAAPLSSKGDRIEYRDGMAENMPWFCRVPAGDFVVPEGLRVWEDTRWSAIRFSRTWEDIKGDPRLTVKDFHPQFTKNLSGRTNTVVELYEVRDKKTSRVFIMAMDKEKASILLDEFDEMQDPSLPNYPLVFNDDDEVFWGVPDSKILEPHQLEINETRTQMMKHRRLSLVKIIARKKGIDEDQAAKLVDETVMPVLWVNGDVDKMLKIIETGGIPQDLFASNELTLRDVRETVGFSRNQFGEYEPGSADRTATEATIVRQASEIRVDERRDMIADLIVDVIEGMHQIIFRRWGADEVVDLIGPGGVPVWVKFSGELLRSGRYTIKVDPDTSLPQTRALREQKAVQVYQLMKTNPLIDPIQLTQYLLHEMHGVQFDTMMRMLPALGQQPSGPVNPEEFGGMVQEGMRQAQALPRESMNGTGNASV